MTTQTIDQTRADAFVDKALGDLSATTTYLLTMLGDRLDLFKTLATQGPATSVELAERAGITERYAREWLAGLAAAGYLDYDPATTRYTLPPEHEPVLAEGWRRCPRCSTSSKPARTSPTGCPPAPTTSCHL